MQYREPRQTQGSDGHALELPHYVVLGSSGAVAVLDHTTLASHVPATSTAAWLAGVAIFEGGLIMRDSCFEGPASGSTPFQAVTVAASSGTMVNSVIKRGSLVARGEGILSAKGCSNAADVGPGVEADAQEGPCKVTLEECQVASAHDAAVVSGWLGRLGNLLTMLPGCVGCCFCAPQLYGPVWELGIHVRHGQPCMASLHGYPKHTCTLPFLVQTVLGLEGPNATTTPETVPLRCCSLQGTVGLYAKGKAACSLEACSIVAKVSQEGL